MNNTTCIVNGGTPNQMRFADVCPHCLQECVEIDPAGSLENMSCDPTEGVFMSAFCSHCGWEGTIEFSYDATWTFEH